MKKVLLLSQLLLGSSLLACGGQSQTEPVESVDGGLLPEPSVLVVRGQVRSAPIPDYPLPEDLAFDLSLREVGDNSELVLAEDAAELEKLPFKDDGKYSATVEMSGSPEDVVAIYLQPPAGDDILAPVITTERVGDATQIDLDACILEKSWVLGWQKNEKVEGHDFLAEGIALLQFVDKDGKPVSDVSAQVVPSDPTAVAPSVHYLGTDGKTIYQPEVTSSSGLAIVVGLTGTATVQASKDGVTFETATVSKPYRGVLVETIGEVAQ